MKLLKPLKVLAALLGAAFVLTACAPFGAVKRDEPQGIKTGLLDIELTPMLERQGDAVQMLYFNPERSLVLRQADGHELLLDDASSNTAQLSSAVLHSDGQSLYALWRPKLIKDVDGLGVTGSKFIYFRASQDGGKSFSPVQRLNREGGAFKPRIASSGTANLYVAWTDERNSGRGQDIYVNASSDRGASWKEDVRMSGAESTVSVDPSVVADGQRAYVSWMTRAPSGEFKIFVRSTEDGGANWLPPVAANVSVAQPATARLVKAGQGLLLCWGERDAVRCKRSLDHAKSWSDSVVLPDSEGAAGLFMQTDRQNRAHLLIVRKPDDETAKINLFHVLSEDGSVFSAPHRLNGGEAFKSSTIMPVMSFGDDHSMLAAWLDMRYARPVIAANYSADGGKTWLPDSVVLAGRTGVVTVFPTISYAGHGRYAAAWQEAAKRGSSSTLIAQTEYRPGMAGIAMPKPDMARLKQRADAFWRLREQDKWGEVYKLLDPYFQEGMPENAYVRSQGNVKYHSHRLVGEPKLDGNLAKVGVAYESEVPELMLKGKPVNVPKNEVEILQDWVWVDGDWYQVYRDLMGTSSLLD